VSEPLALEGVWMEALGLLEDKGLILRLAVRDHDLKKTFLFCSELMFFDLFSGTQEKPCPALLVSSLSTRFHLWVLHRVGGD